MVFQRDVCPFNDLESTCIIVSTLEMHPRLWSATSPKLLLPQGRLVLPSTLFPMTMLT